MQGEKSDEASMDDLIRFLRNRRLDESLLNKLTEDKIDCSVLILMTEEELKQYIPTYGDRVAALAFARKCSNDTESLNRKETVLERLKRKLENRKEKKCQSEFSSKSRLLGNTNAKQEMRRIELGWMDYDAKLGDFRQVRCQNGGGTRSLNIPKSATQEDVIEVGKSLFFPDGKSKKGPVDNFNLVLKDFQAGDIKEKTIEDMYTGYKLKMLRVYLCSKAKNVNCFPDSSPPPIESELAGVPDYSNITVTTSNTPTEVPNVNTTVTDAVTTPTITRVMEDPCMSSAQFVDADTPTISFRVAAPSATPDAGVDRMMDDTDVECMDDLPVITRRNRRSLSLQRRTTSTVTCTTEDSDMQEAIRRSLEYESPEPSLEGMLKQWINKTLIDNCGTQQVLVHRKKIYRSTQWAIRHPSFRFEKPVKVTFSGELGEDSGGPRREFFRELMKELERDITIGPDGNKIFKHDIQKLQDRSYEMAGKIVSWSLLQGGPGFPVLNSELYSLITGQDSTRIDLSVVDLDTKTIIESIQNAATENDLQHVFQNNFDWFVEQGIVVYGKKSEHKEELLKNIFKNAIFYLSHTEITQFTEGLNFIGGFFNYLMKKPEAVKILFVKSKEKLTFDAFRKLYDVKYDELGSNNRAAEEDTIFCFEKFLMDSEAGQTEVALEELLSFWTGASTLPPLGFQNKLEVQFVSSDSPRLPKAYTCGLVLELCRGLTDPDLFRQDNLVWWFPSSLIISNC